MSTYPVRVDATLSPQLSRGLWLVKWLLVVPHLVVLAFLWVAFVLVSIVAFFAILFTGRYPRGLFDFTVGVLRWTWRVGVYSYGALSTDRYPPFTLADVPDYPAHLDVAYPEQLSRGLVLVKWWLLAIPHYLVVGVFLGGGTWFGPRDGGDAPGLISLLVLFAGVVLLFRRHYPQPVFDLVIGLQRWVLRVVGYAALMTDEYPPLRLDMGGAEPAEISPEPVAAEVTRHHGWTVGRVVSLVLGCVVGLASLGMLAGGGALAWVDSSQRDAGGYLSSGSHRFSTTSYALSSKGIDLGTGSGLVQDLVGTVRIRATATDQAREVFVGIAPQDQAETYLSGVSHEVVSRWSEGRPRYSQRAGSAPGTAPPDATLWTAYASGPGTQTITWKPTDGSWVLVLMNPDGSAGVSVDADAGATVPHLGAFAGGLLGAGAVLLLVGVLLVAVPVVKASR
jgi:hypothetical protein